MQSQKNAAIAVAILLVAAIFWLAGGDKFWDRRETQVPPPAQTDTATPEPFLGTIIQIEDDALVLRVVDKFVERLPFRLVRARLTPDTVLVNLPAEKLSAVAIPATVTVHPTTDLGNKKEVEAVRVLFPPPPTAAASSSPSADAVIPLAPSPR